MKVKLHVKDGGFVTEGEIPDFDEPPEVLVWGERVFVRDPFRTSRGDQWVRYKEAWSYVMVKRG